MVGRPCSLRRLAALLVVAVACSGALACSKDSGSDRGATTTSTTKDGSAGSVTTSPSSATTNPDDPTPTSDPGPTTQPGPATTVDPNAPPPQDFGGSFDGQGAGTSISFTKASNVSSVEVRGLEVDCNPITGDGDPTTTRIDLSFPNVPVGADGSVELDLPDDRYHPTLSGIFTPDGSFAGNVYVSFEQKGSACGGDHPFTATPS